VVDALVTNGDRMTAQNRQQLEHMTAWRRSENQERLVGKGSAVYMPTGHQPERLARYDMSRPSCQQCGQRLPRPHPTGRPMSYCSPACRQKAYRARGGQTSGTTGEQRHRKRSTGAKIRDDSRGQIT